MKGFAKPFVICNDTPSNIEKMKKIAIFFCLNSANAFKPRASTSDFFSPPAAVGHEGSVKAYTPSNKPITPLATYCIAVLWKPRKSTANIEQMKPTVPNTRMGGNALTVSSPALRNTV